MYIDQDTDNRIAIADLTENEATAIQIATLAISENQANQTDESRFLRRVAMQLDEILSKQACYAIPPNHDNA